ncbi:MAG: hypothetical protein HZA80_01840 [Candidatus Taylorbacteria bacterium]|nr:hypothetical protein [Candidatus Taylorbacteria bacterium]
MNPQPTLNSADIQLIKGVVKEEIDDFALIVGAGFKEVRDEFKIVHKKFDEIDEKFNQIDKRFDELEVRMDRRFNTVDKKLEYLMETKVSYVDHKTLSKRVDKLEEKIA